MLKSRRLTRVLFIIYLLLLIWIILFKLEWPFSQVGTMQSLNTVPYAAPTRINGEIVKSEMIMNVLIFLPYGLYVESLFKRWPFLVKILFAFVISFSFEALQYIFALGASDITDIIHNVLGAVLGVLLYKIISKVFKTSQHANRFLNTLAVITTLFVVTALLVLKISL